MDLACQRLRAQQRILNTFAQVLDDDAEVVVALAGNGRRLVHDQA